MTNVSHWFTTDGNNSGAPPAGAPEGQAPSTVNDNLRAIFGAVARWYSDMDGSIVTAGTGNAFTLTTSNAHAALADIPLTVFRADRANTGPATLNIDGLGAKSINVYGTALASGDIVANKLAAVAYNSAADAFDLLSPVPRTNNINQITAGVVLQRLLGRDSGGSGGVQQISVTGGLEFTGALAIRRSALTGDVTAATGSNSTTIAAIPAGVHASNAETRTGTETAKPVSPAGLHSVFFAGACDGADPTPTFTIASPGMSAWTVARISTGVFRITHNLSTSNLVVTVSPSDISTIADLTALTRNQTTTAFDVNVRSAGTLADNQSFSFVAMRAGS